MGWPEPAPNTDREIAINLVVIIPEHYEASLVARTTESFSRTFKQDGPVEIVLAETNVSQDYGNGRKIDSEIIEELLMLLRKTLQMTVKLKEL